MRNIQRIRLIGASLGLSLLVAFIQQGAVPARASDQAAVTVNSSPSRDRWVEILDPPIALVHPYWLPNGDYSAGHRGLDYRVSLGQAVYSPASAKVWFAGTVVDRPVVSLRTFSGDLIEFEPACSDMSAGASVELGQPVAVVCEPLANYSQHCQKLKCLHYSLRTQDGYISPQARLLQLSPTVLLPRR